MDSQGIAEQGLIIRHLVLPEALAGSVESLAWIGRELGPDAAVSLMAQYSPMILLSASSPQTETARP